MKAVIQRVAKSEVVIEGKVHAAIGRGIHILLGVEQGDSAETAARMAAKICGLRIFDDTAGKMNLSNEEVGGEYMVVSQFTLCADLRKGKRPSFDNAKTPTEAARALYERFCSVLAETTRVPVRTGVFGASMLVKIENEGPATFVVAVE